MKQTDSTEKWQLEASHGTIKTFERKKKSLILYILHLQQGCLQLSINSCLWVSPHCRRGQGAPEPGLRSESRLAGVRWVPRLRSSLQIGMGKGRGWESVTKDSQLGELLLSLSLAQIGRAHV